jgi:hypothetical protein
MATKAAAVTVANTPTSLIIASPQADSVSGADIAVRNTSAVTVFLGGAAVTTSTGFPLFAGESVSMSIGEDAVYGIVVTSTAVVSVLMVGV